MKALLTEWRRNTTTTHPASVRLQVTKHRLPSEIFRIWCSFWGLWLIPIQVMLRCELLLKRLSFKSGTGWQRWLTGRSRKCQWLYFRPLVRAPSSLSQLSSVGSFHPTKSFSTFRMVGLSSFLPVLKYKWLCCSDKRKVMFCAYYETSS